MRTLGLPSRVPLAWTVPAALGMLGGILVGFGSTWGALFVVLGLGLSVWARRPALVLLCLAAAALGGWRIAAWQAQPDVLAPWHGARVTVSGSWDGRFLNLEDPPTRLALAPRPAQGPGELRVSGVLLPGEGRRTPGGFDYGFWLRLQGAGGVLAGASVREYAPERGFRAHFRTGLGAGLAERERALMEAISLGDKGLAGRVESAQDSAMTVREAFVRSGLAHLMALSGLHVGLLTAALLLLLARSPLAGARYPVTLLFLLGYVWLVGPTPSVVRAALMGGAVLLAFWAGRGRPDPPGTVALAALLVLAVQPQWAFDVGFALSFSAVLALLLTPALLARLPPGPLWLRASLAATLLAELATAPQVAYHFGQLPLVSLPANLLAAPLMAVLVPWGFLLGLLGPWAEGLAPLTRLLSGALLGLVDWLGRAPVLPWGQPGAVGFALYGLFALGAALWLRGLLPARGALALALAAMLGSGLSGTLAARSAQEVWYLDVGQGDATLLRLHGLRVLVDGGGTPRSDFDVGARVVVPALRALGVQALDVVVATHADADHIEGLVSVLRLMPVGELWIGHRKEDDALLGELLHVAQVRGVPVREVRRGDVLRRGGAELRVLWPPGGVWSVSDNENSVALLLQAGGQRLAFLGDLPDPTERYLGVGRLDVLKVAHHGSRFSTLGALLQESEPAQAVISVGRNSYGHPAPAVLQRLGEVGTEVWRTDRHGSVRFDLR